MVWVGVLGVGNRGDSHSVIVQHRVSSLGYPWSERWVVRVWAMVLQGVGVMVREVLRYGQDPFRESRARFAVAVESVAVL